MKVLIIILVINEVIQILALIAMLWEDFEENNEKDKMIQSKKDVLRCFIPFFWFKLMINRILNWWNKLKQYI